MLPLQIPELWLSAPLLSVGDHNPPNRFRVFWGLGVGAVAAVLLFAGGLQALQAASVAAALPFSVVMIMMIAGLLHSMHTNPGYELPVATKGKKKDLIAAGIQRAAQS